MSKRLRSTRLATKTKRGVFHQAPEEYKSMNGVIEYNEINSFLEGQIISGLLQQGTVISSPSLWI